MEVHIHSSTVAGKPYHLQREGSIEHRYPISPSAPLPYDPLTCPFLDPISELGDVKKNVDQRMWSLSMNVKEYRPEEVNVRTSPDNVLIIEAEHHDKKDDQDTFYISRQFCRHFSLPSDSNLDELVCNVGTNGILTVIVPRGKEGVDKRDIFEPLNKESHFWHPGSSGPVPHFWVPGVHITEENFMVVLNLPEFVPEEIVVTAIDELLVLEAFRELNSGEAFSIRRRYILPHNADRDRAHCEMDCRGELVITIPRMKDNIYDKEGGISKVYQVFRKMMF